MSVSNLSKIEIKNSSVNSSCKSISRFEEQKEMIQLLDNKLNVSHKFFNNIKIILYYIYRIKDHHPLTKINQLKTVLLM